MNIKFKTKAIYLR